MSFIKIKRKSRTMRLFKPKVIVCIRFAQRKKEQNIGVTKNDNKVGSDKSLMRIYF